MPSCSGQNGMTCISPTAPALDTAQRIEAALDVEHRHDQAWRQHETPVRWVSQ